MENAKPYEIVEFGYEMVAGLTSVGAVLRYGREGDWWRGDVKVYASNRALEGGRVPGYRFAEPVGDGWTLVVEVPAAGLGLAERVGRVRADAAAIVQAFRSMVEDENIHLGEAN